MMEEPSQSFSLCTLGDVRSCLDYWWSSECSNFRPTDITLPLADKAFEEDVDRLYCT